MSSLIPYSPSREIERVWERMDRMMDELLAATRWDPFRDPFAMSPFEPWSALRPWSVFPLEQRFPGDNLAVDLYESDDHLVVKAALPGVRLEDIEVTEQDGYLTIRAKEQEQAERSGDGWRWRGARYAAWQRTLRLPMAVNVQRARAELQDGILTITLPKLEPRKKLTRRIKVGLPKIKLPALKKKGEIRIKQKA
jgi:HSP20 family protein